MAIDFSKFDAEIDTKQLAKDVEEAAKKGGGDFPTVTADDYFVTLEKMELGATKDGRPMLKAQFKIKENTDGDKTFKGQMLFYNRVIYGTKNDPNMIASAVGFMNSLEPSEEVGPVAFESYSQFADLALDIAEDVEGIEYEVTYDPDAFNSIHVIAVYEL